MTIQELNKVLLGLEYPETYEVDAETYAQVCQYAFNWTTEQGPERCGMFRDGKLLVSVVLGKTKNGIMFKNVEIILKGYKDGR